MYHVMYEVVSEVEIYLSGGDCGDREVSFYHTEYEVAGPFNSKQEVARACVQLARNHGTHLKNVEACVDFFTA